LEQLGATLDFTARDLSRLWRALALSDRELIDALGGRRRAELHAAYEDWDRDRSREGASTQSLCQHHPSFPRSLRDDPLGPQVLCVRGGMERLACLLEQKVVAIVGTHRASDYGMQTARELARGLAASGVIVASGLREGIHAAALAGALDGGGYALAVAGGGVERCAPAWCKPLCTRVAESGCVISERRDGGRPRRWWQLGCARTLALIAELVIVVEAEDVPWDLAYAHVARSRGRQVAAVPGRVSSPVSRGTNSLLIGGAKLVRDPRDALDVLYGVGEHVTAEPSDRPTALEPRLRRVLARVGRGEDTIERLLSCGGETKEVVRALTELELQGRLVRGDGGRYLPSAGTRTI
jgi:DNA processing protein